MTDAKKVLVVDDEKNITKILTMLLETRGYQVDIAETGEEALKKAYENPDIILLDLVLPDIPGFEICRKLREQKATRHIPIIILSVRYMYEDKVEGLYLGADDYVTKPFEYEELFARMEAAMRRRHVFEDETQDKAPIILELRRIVDEKLITPFFQPIYYLKPFKLCGLEILSRPPTNSILSNPELLFGAALRFGSYYDLEMLCWKKAFDVLKQTPYQDKIFLNCNPYLVESTEFLKTRSILEGEVDRSNVVLEITERSAIHDYKMFYDRLREYQADGFSIAIDDIGGGYASLESIIEIGPKFIKIDLSIIHEIDRNPLKQSVVKFLLAFARENKILCIAEGIETKEELEAVLDLGVDAGQGYFLGQPAPEIDLQAINRKIF